MKKRVLKSLVAIMLAIMMVVGSSLVVGADMAYNIYSDPDLSETSGKFDTYSVDFRGVQTPNYTYWALATFNLYLSDRSKMYYKNLSGGGGYAGLQNTNPTKGKVSIMSFWEMTYGGGKKMTASLMYPEEGGEGKFTGEGDGTNWIAHMDWKDNRWYRMVLHTWTDVEKGSTFAGQWFQDRETGEWFLITYYDTHLYESCLQGWGMFQENYSHDKNVDLEREFHVKNLYIREFETQNWVSLATARLSYGDGGTANKAGAHSFGATQEYFWGKAGGLVDDQAAYEKEATKSQTYTIQQADTPSFGTPEIDSLELTQSEDGVWSANWDTSDFGTPQLGYKVEAVNTNGKVIYRVEGTRPEVESKALPGLNSDEFLCRVTVTDIFGQETTIETATEAYTAAMKEKEEEQEKEDDKTDDTTTQPSVDDTKKDSGSIGLIIGIAVAALAVIGGVSAIVVLKKKKQ